MDNNPDNKVALPTAITLPAGQTGWKRYALDAAELFIPPTNTNFQSELPPMSSIFASVKIIELCQRKRHMRNLLNK